MAPDTTIWLMVQRLAPEKEPPLHRSLPCSLPKLHQLSIPSPARCDARARLGDAQGSVIRRNFSSVFDVRRPGSLTALLAAKDTQKALKALADLKGKKVRCALEQCFLREILFVLRCKLPKHISVQANNSRMTDVHSAAQQPS